jgi:hypothetical protein
MTTNDLIFGGEGYKSPLQNIRCAGCGLITVRKDIESESGLCLAVCYPEAMADMDRYYAMSEHDEYINAH